MKNKLLKNIELKIVSLFIALFIWIGVYNIADPVVEESFNNVAITIENPEVITDLGKTYQVANGTLTTTVTVKAKRSLVDEIQIEDLIATADFKEIQLQSFVPITVEVKGLTDGEFEASATPGNLELIVEDSESKTFPITAVALGEAREGFSLGELVVDPETITISGPKSLVEDIDRVVAQVDVFNVSANTVLEADIIIYGDDDTVMDSTLLTQKLDKDPEVHVEVLESKEIPIAATVGGTPPEGYKVANVTIEPQTISLVGEKELIESISEIEIPASAIDVTDTTGKLEQVVDITKYLPEGLKLVDDTLNSIVITVQVDQIGTRTVEVPVESVEVLNNPENLNLTYDQTEGIILTYEGEDESLDQISVDKMKLSIDLSGYSKEGKYEVPVTVSSIDGVTLLNPAIVKIQLTDK